MTDAGRRHDAALKLTYYFGVHLRWSEEETLSALAGAVATLVGRYHDGTAEGGRDHRVVVAVHPSVRPETKES
jgi:hypothetical protein